jgi:hypothetical protein
MLEQGIRQWRIKAYVRDSDCVAVCIGVCPVSKARPAGKAVFYKIEAGRLIVEPIPSLTEVLEENPLVEITFEEFRKQRKELSTEAKIWTLTAEVQWAEQ